jgi:hypothetical protein
MAAAARRLAVVIPASVMSGAEERVATGGELTLFEAAGVDPVLRTPRVFRR